MTHAFRSLSVCVALAATLAAGSPAGAQELSGSVFGTVGYAASNRSYAYQRSIDRGGSFERDTVLGAQGDWRITPQWSATVQVKLAQSLEQDRRWDVTPTWAFVAFRPNDDWLLRAGRFRAPLYLHSESLDVGVTHDMARLPAEMYLIAPATEFDGGYATRTWLRGADEISLDGYSGRLRSTARFWLSDGLPPLLPAGTLFTGITVRSSGLVLTWRQPEATWRAGLHMTNTRRSDGVPVDVRYPFVPVAPGLGYYRVSAALPGPPIPTVGSVTNTVGTFGFEQRLAGGWRLSGEWARNLQRDTELGSESSGGYLALLREWGRVTPYASLGTLRSGGTQREWYRRLSGTVLPGAVPGADAINAAMRATSQSTYVYDQRSAALGASFTVDSKQKLKLEWLRVRLGEVSQLVDGPPGVPAPSRTHIDVWSLNYSFAF